MVIDEIHSFIGTDRGIQLKSILYRLQEKNGTPFRIIGLSATIGDYDEAKKITGNEARTKVLLDRSKKPCTPNFVILTGKMRQNCHQILSKISIGTCMPIKPLYFLTAGDVLKRLR